MRSTTKYWVRAEDVSNVKYHILQHLPVFQFDTDKFAGDAQLINSVYFDNENLELYHGRLDKKPNAIAVRIRCGTPGRWRCFFQCCAAFVVVVTALAQAACALSHAGAPACSR